MKENYKQLGLDIRYAVSDEAEDLLSEINKHLTQIENLLQSLKETESEGREVVSPDDAQIYRKLKLDLRFTVRRWQRMLAAESRIRKVHEKGNHVSTFAA